MRCHICDSDTDSLKFEQGAFTPCTVCEQAIIECLQGYDDPDFVDLLEQEENPDSSQSEVDHTERQCRDWAYGAGEQSLSEPW